MTPVATIGIAELRAQASGVRPTGGTRPGEPRRSPAVPVIVVVCAALLALSAGWTGPGVWGPGSAPAYAAPSTFVPLESAPPGGTAVGLPGTGAGTGSISTPPGSTAPQTALASSCTAPCSSSQVVSVTILPGPLTVDGVGDVAVSTGSDGTGSARLSGVRVTDLRGSPVGWTLAGELASVVDGSGATVEGATVEFAPSCVRTAGPLTLETAQRSVVGVGRSAPWCVVPIASAGSLAGGVVVATIDLTLRGAPADTTVLLRLEAVVA